MGDACGPSNLPSVKEEGEEEESFGTGAKRKKRGGGVAQSKIMFRCKFTSFERVPYSAAPPSRESQSIPRHSGSRGLYNFNLTSACRVEHFDEGWTNVREKWKDDVSTYEGDIEVESTMTYVSTYISQFFTEAIFRAEDKRAES
ncbi:hypothetical protein QLX08_009618 [Tetragonisca angustula]|uniref:Uncharacterized protein n=1 Tax=Tetragonisca angustula TaxID=166442 RepID=A0AAW0ZF53_9HYME